MGAANLKLHKLQFWCEIHATKYVTGLLKMTNTVTYKTMTDNVELATLCITDYHVSKLTECRVTQSINLVNDMIYGDAQHYVAFSPICIYMYTLSSLAYHYRCLDLSYQYCLQCLLTNLQKTCNICWLYWRWPTLFL